MDSMDCNEVRARIVDATVTRQPLSPEDLRHVGGCSSCQAEAADLAELWDSLGVAVRMPPEPAVLDTLLARARPQVERIRRRETRRTRALLAAGFVLTALVGALGGFAFGRGDDPTGAAAASGERQFLLLLHEAPSAETPRSVGETMAIVDEYRRWAARLDDNGRLVAAEKLANDGGRWLTDEASPPPRDVVTGYFVVRARDYEDALRVARSGPHLRYGGRIEVRAIEGT